ncbi:MAG TPA: MAPEG family protein, partial [Burkholderiaceae bacterium]
MQSYPAWPAFALALTALFTKTTLTSILQVVSRLRAKTFLLPEDARLMGVRPVASEAQLVQRCAGVWRNDTENLPLFLALALAYVLGGASLGSAALLFGLYVAARYLHTLAYLFG